jgi:antitoxin component YwqK of YwqJK toxin-antitoxin module
VWINYEYDIYGNNIKVTLFNTDDNAEGSIHLHQWREIEWDADGSAVKLVAYDSDGLIIRWYEWEYDENGNCIREIRYNADGSILQRQEIEWDADGNFIRAVVYNADGSVRQ